MCISLWNFNIATPLLNFFTVAPDRYSRGQFAGTAVDFAIQCERAQGLPMAGPHVPMVATGDSHDIHANHSCGDMRIMGMHPPHVLADVSPTVSPIICCTPFPIVSTYEKRGLLYLIPSRGTNPIIIGPFPMIYT